MNREANTHEPVDVDPAAAAEAENLVGAADELLAEALAPGSWPEAEVAERFLTEGKLDRVLALYGQAMRLDPSEPAYPWNLASAINRLGLNDLAIGFMTRAIHLAAAAGESEWSGPDAQLALAEVALDAGEADIALTALAHAREGDDRGSRESQIRELLETIRAERHDPQPQASLATLLEQLPA